MRTDTRPVISMDLGTSSVRACLVSPSLEILYQTQEQVLLDLDTRGKAVQDADAIIKTGLRCLEDVLDWALDAGLQPEAICFSNAIASLVRLDADFNPLAPAMTYIDLRAKAESDRLVHDYGAAYFQFTATPMHASYWLPKFVWMKEQVEGFSQSAYYCTIKDLFVYRLTGQFVIDRSNAVATGMCDVRTGGWDSRLIAIAGINQAQLPEIRPTTTVLPLAEDSLLTAERRPEDLRVVLGAMDGVLSSLGAGAFKPGQVTTMIGSSGACRIAAKGPIIDTESFATWSYPLDEETWICGGAMNNGGLVTEWLVRNFSASRTTNGAAYTEMLEQAEEISAGADGLLFLPYLYGERAPIYDENARGVFFGLHADHNRGHFARAGLEGILLALYSIYELIQPAEGEIEVRATGGYLRSELMLQIQADIFGVPIHVPANLEGSSIGAAALAMKALGRITSFDEISEFIPIEKSYVPDPQKTAIYREITPRFRKLYNGVKLLFSTSTGLDK